MAADHLGGAHVVRPHHDLVRVALVGEVGAQVVVGLHDRDRARQVVVAEEPGVHGHGRHGEGDERTAGQHERDARAGQHAAQHEAPDPALAVGAPVAAEQRDARTIDPVADQREDGGQGDETAEDGGADDQDGADREALEDRVAREEHAGHGRDDREAADGHRAAGGGCGGQDRVAVRGAAGPLLAGAAQVEQRVVDADRHADQQDHAGHRVGHRDEVARDAGQAERGGDAGERQQHRDAGGDQGAEREDQDAQGDGQRQPLGLLEVLAERVVERLLDAPAADLVDLQAGVRRLHRGGRRERGVDAVAGAVRVARDGPGDERRLAVGGALRRLEALARRAGPAGGRRRRRRRPGGRRRRGASRRGCGRGCSPAPAGRGRPTRSGPTRGPSRRCPPASR